MKCFKAWSSSSSVFLFSIAKYWVSVRGLVPLTAAGRQIFFSHSQTRRCGGLVGKSWRQPAPVPSFFCRYSLGLPPTAPLDTSSLPIFRNCTIFFGLEMVNRENTCHQGNAQITVICSRNRDVWARIRVGRENKKLLWWLIDRIGFLRDDCQIKIYRKRRKK